MASLSVGRQSDKVHASNPCRSKYQFRISYYLRVIAIIYTYVWFVFVHSIMSDMFCDPMAIVLISYNYNFDTFASLPNE